MSEKEASCFNELTDEELVKLSQEGDNLALDTLARRFLSHKPKMYNAGYLDVDDLLHQESYQEKPKIIRCSLGNRELGKLQW